MIFAVLSACIPIMPTMGDINYSMVQANQAGLANHKAVLGVGGSY